MDFLIFLKGTMDPLDIVTIVVMGVLAAAFVLGVQWLCIRLGLFKGAPVRTIGSLLIPEMSRPPAAELAIQVIASVIFTIAYAFVFHFAVPDSLWGFISTGALIGLIHGTFVSFFVATGLSGVALEDQSYTIGTAMFNVLLQALFGTLVGVGYGFAELKHMFPQFVAFAVVVGLVAAGVARLLTGPHQPKLSKPMAH